MQSHDTTTADLLSVAQVAAEVNRSHRTILHWIAANKIAATKLGPGTASYVITRAEVERIKTMDAAA